MDKKHIVKAVEIISVLVPSVGVSTGKAETFSVGAGSFSTTERQQWAAPGWSSL